MDFELLGENFEELFLELVKVRDMRKLLVLGVVKNTSSADLFVLSCVVEVGDDPRAELSVAADG